MSNTLHAPSGTSPEHLLPDPQPLAFPAHHSGSSVPQQKRQSSITGYPCNSSSKRTPVTAAPPAASPQTHSAAQSRFATPPHRRGTRKPVLQPAMPLKTPTPSTYDMPASPGATHAPGNSNSDLTGSSPMDQSAPAHEGLGQLPALQAPVDAVPLQLRAMSEEEQQLATKLKETYKNIVNYEEIVQKSCIELTIKINQSNLSSTSTQYTSSIYSQLQPQFLASSVPLHTAAPVNTTDLSNSLWTIYYHNVTLLNNYYDFLITALKPTANTAQFKTGKNIVDLYKIPRRMWVYGIVGFLEVLKNIMTIFQEHEIFSCFIAYCFNAVSNLTDPSLEMEGWWCEKLGDLSRMAIALYASKFIDWKISAEYWYSVVMRTMYGHGKIYYHMCTVQQDNLDALVNIGKSVICRDPFVPTQQYLRLVVENICTQRNILSLLELPIIDFIKIHKVLLSIHSNVASAPNNIDQLNNEAEILDSQIQYGIDLVTRYGVTFGCDSHGYNFFTKSFCIPGGVQNKYGADSYDLYVNQQEHDSQGNMLNTIEKMNFWFNKGSLFAIANINHLVGFGDPKNPFAKIFHLPEALKERREKKERKRRSKSINTQDDNQSNMGASPSGIAGSECSFLVASELSSADWFYSLTYINKSVLKLSFRILNHYIIGPKQASTRHIIVWLYFLISVGEASKKYPESKNMFMWLFRRFFPWNSLINYLNALISVVGNNSNLNSICRNYLLNYPNYVDHFNNNEFLPEVWKCWGTLWFDVIAPKGDFSTLEAAGVHDEDLFDLPVCGTSPIINIISGSENNSQRGKSKSAVQQERNNDERLVRIILLARLLADTYDFGLVRTAEGFKFDEATHNKPDSDYLISSSATNMTNELFAFAHEVMHGDPRMTQSNFLVPISPSNLVSSNIFSNLSPQEKDDYWFHIRDEKEEAQEARNHLGEEIAEDEEIEGYADSEFEEGTDYEQGIFDSRMMDGVQTADSFNVQQNGHSETLQQNYNALYSESYVMNSDVIPYLSNNHMHIEGDLGDRIDSALTYITLDTNIWLKHCGRIFKCVRNHIFKVLIPLIVFQELRSLRKSAEATIADAATRSVIIIRELYLSREIVPLRFDGTVASDVNETSEFENNPSWMSNVDLTILNVVNEHDEMSKKLLKGFNITINSSNPTVLDKNGARLFRYCILVTDDRNMRLRAKTSGLTSYQSKWLFSQLDANFSHKCID